MNSLNQCLLVKKGVALTLLMYLIVFPVNGQNENDLVSDSIINVQDGKKLMWDMSLAVKTMNVFRGLLPSNAPTFSTQLGVRYGDFIGGFYGGASFNGGYTETDLILIFYRPKIQLRLDWYYNFTEGITNIPEASGFFDFNPQVTRGLLDLMVDVKLTKNTSLFSSTFLYGRDRGVLQEDLENDVQLRRGDQRYTQLVQLSYNWYWGTSKIIAHAGYSFSWNKPSGETFYGDKPGFNDIGITYYQTLIQTNRLTIPVKAMINVNTVSNDVYLSAAILLIDLNREKFKPN